MPDPEAIRPYATANCKSCAGYVETAELLARDGERYDGAAVSVQSGAYLPESTSSVVLVRIINIQEQRNIVDRTTGAVVERLPRQLNQAELEVTWGGSLGWRINAVRDVQVKRP